MKMFKVINPATNEDVLGGVVSGDNVYISLYAKVCDGHKRIADLEIGESTQCEYNMNGVNGAYLVVRQPDTYRPLWLDADDVTVK